MPELPEVETVRRTLLPLLGAEFRSLWWSGKNLRLNQAFAEKALKKVSKKNTLIDVRRLGKFLLLDLRDNEASILVHLGMSGRLRHFRSDEARPPHTHVEWRLDKGRLLRFTDPRRFGQVELVQRGKERSHPSLKRLGPDPIVDTLDKEALVASLKKKRSPIKVAILDQSWLAGVGNIYASEALHRAGIHPGQQATRLSKARLHTLLEATVAVMEDALTHGGTSLKDFVSADGHAGEHSHYLKVYGRTGQACSRRACSSKIRRSVQQNRATFYCPTCQKR